MSQLAADNDALNLSQGFPDFDGPLNLRKALANAVMTGNNQYAPMIGLGSLREQIALKLQRFYQVSCDCESEITVTPGATEALFCAIQAFINSGDEVIVFDPCYDSYEPAITLAGGVTRHLPLQLPGFAIDWDQVASTISARTRMIIINSPHNPSGALLAEADLLNLQQLACQHDLIVLSDEVYEHLVFDGNQHRSVLQYPALRERSIAVFSFGKTFHITGWKTGYCVAPPALMAELRKVHQFVTFVAVTPVQQALADFMAAEPDYPSTLANFYQAKRDQFCRELEPSRFSLVPSPGTYFQLLDYSAISDELDTEIAVRLTRDVGIASIPISVFCEQSLPAYYLRFCFAKQAGTLTQAAKLLCEI
nr:methionine aminotransferase [Candidatus Litorirhabdus singularis]